MRCDALADAAVSGVCCGAMRCGALIQSAGCCVLLCARAGGKKRKLEGARQPCSLCDAMCSVQRAVHNVHNVHHMQCAAMCSVHLLRCDVRWRVRSDAMRSLCILAGLRAAMRGTRLR